MESYTECPSLTYIELPIKTYIGKNKDVFSMSRLHNRHKSLMFLVATDRISAFDHVLQGQTIPYKGQIITSMSEFWFQTLKDIVPNHFIDRIGTNTLAVTPCEIIPIEVVVRRHIIGSTSTSLWTFYESGQREIYGQHFPDGLQKGDRLPEPVITPTTKSRIRDEPMTIDAPVLMNLVSYRDWEYIKEVSLELFRVAEKITTAEGLELADWKVEFGRLGDGKIILADDIGAPDCSRFLLNGNHVDKELIRCYIKDSGYDSTSSIVFPTEFTTKVSHAYQSVMVSITGEQVIPYSRKQILHDIIDYLENA